MSSALLPLESKRDTKLIVTPDMKTKDSIRDVGFSVFRILSIMQSDEQEHKYAKFGSTYLKYRKIVVEWMVDVCEYFSLHATTTLAAIAYLDRLQPNEKYTRSEWQMLAICCILISSKYNESEEHVPDLATLEEITQQSISTEDVLNFELWTLQRLSWSLNARTSMAFLSCYLCTDLCYPSKKGENGTGSSDISSSMEQHFEALSSMCALDCSFKAIPCSMLAASILFYTRGLLKISPTWCDELTKLTTYGALTLSDVVTKIHDASSAGRGVSIGKAGGTLKNVNADEYKNLVENAVTDCLAVMLSTPTSKEKDESRALTPVSVAIMETF